MQKSRLAPGGRNIFQTVRAKRDEAIGKGRKVIDLSIGEPRGPALASARISAAQAILSEREAMHSYQYNASAAVPDFPRRFVEAHINKSLADETIAFLPIPGIKPVLGLPQLASGAAERSLKVGTMTAPGYPSPADWCGLLSRVEHYALNISTQNEFRFALEDISADTDLLMINYPHNPTGQVADRQWLRELCRYCAANDIRLFNDAAYCILTHGHDAVTLTELAVEFEGLSWSEAFTAAKLIGNGTGWHVGAIAGSPDFIADMNVIKGKMDTGLVPAMAAGALASLETDRENINQIRQMYERRLELFCSILERHGMRLALRPAAGFFTLWETPTSAFGQPVADAESFNNQMIDQVGLVGVPFPGFVRYAVCADVEAMLDEIDAAFKAAAVRYSSLPQW